MADELVLRAQRFFNTTYSGYAGMPKLEENGRASWAVMYALTRALQLEIGVSPQSNAFRPVSRRFTSPERWRRALDTGTPTGASTRWIYSLPSR